MQEDNKNNADGNLSVLLALKLAFLDTMKYRGLPLGQYTSLIVMLMLHIDTTIILGLSLEHSPKLKRKLSLANIINTSPYPYTNNRRH